MIIDERVESDNYSASGGSVLGPTQLIKNREYLHIFPKSDVADQKSVKKP